MSGLRKKIFQIYKSPRRNSQKTSSSKKPTVPERPAALKSDKRITKTKTLQKENKKIRSIRKDEESDSNDDKADEGNEVYKVNEAYEANKANKSDEYQNKIIKINKTFMMYITELKPGWLTGLDNLSHKECWFSSICWELRRNQATDISDWKIGAVLFQKDTENLEYPIAYIRIDIVGLLKQTTMGKKYIMVDTDYFIKWIKARAIEKEHHIPEISIILCQIESISCLIRVRKIFATVQNNDCTIDKRPQEISIERGNVCGETNW
ncbi:hypothetical protein Glove_109g230 [Diversispora epigaea]|uniref:Uncharacterized protein n=1 Tax=Diversispora epigaea TaxID=1348612 RepID=A0A397J4N6_9GLOM|nr:hypothetical protein Glove_109g230 [Diversispora epigaea]